VGRTPPQNQGQGYRVPAPAPDALIAWPDAFGTRFCVFVDTEEEFDWAAPFSREAFGTRAIAALPAAHARFVDHGVPLTYLADYPVASAPVAVEILARLIEDGRSTLGTQLHPWVNPPFEEEIGDLNSFAGNLALALEGAKLTLLTDTITRNFGTRPIVYRAGRYGIGPNTLRLLAELGYRVDSSMRPAYDYSSEGGPDFSRISNHAFRASPDGAMLELPLTTVFTGGVRAGGAGLYRRLSRIPHARGVAARLRLLSRVALTPEDMPLDEAMEAVRVAVGEGVRLLNFSFHSPSVEPGHTPYVRDQADLAAFHHWWERIFALLAGLGVAPASLSEIVAAADAACGAAQPSASAAGAGGL